MTNITDPEQLWKIQKNKLRMMFSQLEDHDFHFDYGKKDVMMEELHKKLGKSREELDTLLLSL